MPVFSLPSVISTILYSHSVDIKHMKTVTVPLFLLISQTTPCFGGGAASYIHLSSAYFGQQNTLLGQTSSNQGYGFSVEWNSQKERLRDTGWFARGVTLSSTQSSFYSEYSTTIPLFQIAKRHGLWTSITRRSQQFTTTLDSSQIYLDKEGNPSPVAAGSDLSAELNTQEVVWSWREESHEATLLNEISLVYCTQSTPVQVNLSTTNATLFDGSFSGWGLRIAKRQQPRGFNLNWSLDVFELESYFSDDATGHRQQAPAESRTLFTRFTLEWQYRQYLAPYWYAKPFAQYSLQAYLQPQSAPSVVDQPTMTQSQWKIGMAIQKWF